MKPRGITLVVVTALTLGACSSRESINLESRYSNAEQGYSLTQPEGWRPSIVRGHAQFTPSNIERAKHRIVVRATPKLESIIEGKATSREDVVAATEKVLAALPRIKLASKRALDDTQVPATRFSLTFVPNGRGRAYRREHVVMFGAKQVLHLIYTAPAGEALDETAFAKMVSTLAEEV